MRYTEKEQLYNTNTSILFPVIRTYHFDSLHYIAFELVSLIYIVLMQ